MKLYLIAGEASGDSHGAEVMRKLKQLAAGCKPAERLELYGAGGPKMKAIAPAIQDWSGEAVVGLWDVLKKYGYFKRQFDSMRREIAEIQPDAVVLIDYPGFNLRMAKALKKQNPALQIIYYISPQVWAWNRGRIPQMAKTLDLMLCIFPFEKALYEESGLKTIFVGHPMLDSLAAKKNPQAFPRSEDLVGLFPGSRTKEVAHNFPVMLAACEKMHHARPELRFEAAAASERLAVTMRQLATEFTHSSGVPVKVTTGLSHQLMQQAAVGMVASGTATMETAFFGMPFVICYRVAFLTWEVGKRLIRVPFLGMVNILAQRQIVPEFLQDGADPLLIADELLALLNTPEKKAAQLADLAEVIQGLGEGGASERAAGAIWSNLRPKRK